VVEAQLKFREGHYGAIATAMNLAQMAKKMSDSPETRENISNLEKERQDVADTILKGKILLGQKKWDEALAAWEKVKIYRREENARDSDLSGFMSDYSEGLRRSGEAHTGLGESRLSEGAFDEALREFEFALLRTPGAVGALGGRKETLIRRTVRQSQELRALSMPEPRKAREGVLSLMKQAGFGNEPRLAAELHNSSCQLADQLVTHARPAVAVVVAQAVKTPPPPPRPNNTKKGAVRPQPPAPAPQEVSAPSLVKIKSIVTGKDRDGFADALTELTEAAEICATPQTRELITQVTIQLSYYHAAVARKAAAGQPPRPATVLAHANTALSYRPDRQDIAALAETARQQFQQQTRIYVGVAFTDDSPRRECDGAPAQLASFSDGALRSSISGNVTAATGSEAQSLMARRGNGQSQWAVLSAHVKACSVSKDANNGKQVAEKSESWRDQTKTTKDP
jgi:tetratricopeptide (TPR) repeat protein